MSSILGKNYFGRNFQLISYAILYLSVRPGNSIMMDNQALIGPLLAIDIGNIKTRAMLVGVEGERCYLQGISKTATTLGSNGTDVRHGVQLALEELQAITGRTLLDLHKQVIKPVTRDGDGVNHFIVTASVGVPIKIYLKRCVYGGQTMICGDNLRIVCIVDWIHLNKRIII